MNSVSEHCMAQSAEQPLSEEESTSSSQRMYWSGLEVETESESDVDVDGRNMLRLEQLVAQQRLNESEDDSSEETKEEESKQEEDSEQSDSESASNDDDETEHQLKSEDIEELKEYVNKVRNCRQILPQIAFVHFNQLKNHWIRQSVSDRVICDYGQLSTQKQIKCHSDGDAEEETKQTTDEPHSDSELKEAPKIQIICDNAPHHTENKAWIRQQMKRHQMLWWVTRDLKKLQRG